MTVREIIRELEASGITDWNAIVSEAATRAGCTRARACDVYRMLHPDIRHDGRTQTMPQTPRPDKLRAGRSLAEFQQAYDKDTIVPAKIRKALAELGDAWEYETDFVRRSGVGFGDLGNYREMFAEHYVTIRQDGGKRVWAGTPEFAAKLREMV